MSNTLWVLWGGFAIGLAFGAVGQRLEFCVAGGLREWWREGDPRRAAAVILAMATALAGTQALEAAGYIDTGQSIYLQPGFSWLLMPLGGLLFGYGMILARGCGARALVLLPDGNLRSLVVLLCLGISAYAMLTGVLAPLRLPVAEATTVSPGLPRPGLPDLLESFGLGAAPSRAGPTLLVAAALGWLALAKLRLWRKPVQAVGAAAVGALVPLGWLVTGYFGDDDFEPARVESLTFVAPIGDAIQYLMLSTGISAGFGVTVVGGVLLGSLAASLASRDFELRSFEKPNDLLRSGGGGLLMGTGGALALGCSIGQGLTGFSTLSLPSLLALAAIWLGALTALRGPLRLRD